MDKFGLCSLRCKEEKKGNELKTMLSKLTANYTSIFLMVTITWSPPSRYTRNKGGLISSAPQVIQNNFLAVVSCAESPFYQSRDCSWETHHSANDVCILDVEVVIAHCSPFTIVEDLDTTFPITRSIDQTNLNSWKWFKGKRLFRFLGLWKIIMIWWHNKTGEEIQVELMLYWNGNYDSQMEHHA